MEEALRAPPAQKPRLAFFQWNHFPNLGASSFLALHMQHHVKCLSQFFEVTVINEDCDYAAVCDRLEPDLALFEAGYRSHGSRRLRIANTAANPGVPKLGLHNGDPWCDRRSGFLADMEAWGIDTYFTIGTAMPEYTPAIADRTFVWPNFFDPAMFRDHGLQKVIPVALIGQAYRLYPWRQKVYDTLSKHYPCLVTPPFQYESGAARRMLAGESYARALNAAWASPSCGTMGHELVRKHLEIPACASLLIAERTPALEAAGFADDISCVFAEPDEVLDRLDALFADEDHLRQITRAGHRLVHDRHTMQQRSQIREWYDLNRMLKAGQRIRQPGPFAPLCIVEAAGWRGHGHLVGRGLDRLALQRAAGLMAADDSAGARDALQTALDYVPYLPEAHLGLALCDLVEGHPEAALPRLARSIETTLVDYGAATPDAVEWALYLVALLAAGRGPEAIALRDRYPGLSHPELDHIVRALDRLAGKARPEAPRGAGRPASIHPMPERSEAAYLDWLDGLLARAGQPALTPKRLAAAHASGLWLRGLDRVMRRTGVRPDLPPAREFRYLRQLGRSVAVKILGARGLDGLRKLRAALRSLAAGGPSRPAVKGHRGNRRL
ncbi:glycosyltransferase [bacterium]|nr:glycosyltransferase [bacterium]